MYRFNLNMILFVELALETNSIKQTANNFTIKNIEFYFEQNLSKSKTI